jgi:hypothetical protein
LFVCRRGRDVPVTQVAHEKDEDADGWPLLTLRQLGRYAPCDAPLPRVKCVMGDMSEWWRGGGVRGRAREHKGTIMCRVTCVQR